MLLNGSILLEVILLVSSCLCQEYDVEDNSEVSHYESEGGEHEHPDYSKYYSIDTGNAPETGFVGGGEFFAPQPIIYAESKKKPVATSELSFLPQQKQSENYDYFPAESGLRDFFEEAQKRDQQQQQENDEYVSPGPSYISHLVQPAASRDDVERIPPRPNRPKPKHDTNEDEEIYKIPEFNLKSTNPQVDFNTDKSSSSANHYPSASGQPNLSSYNKYSFQPSSSEAASETVSPYNKFSFQPSQSEAASEIKPFNPSYQTTREPIIALASNKKNCRRIETPSSAESDKMNCFACEDESTNSKYTQCSYSTDKEPHEYYSGNSESYSSPSKDSTGYRYKRYTSDSKSSDPYYIVRERSRKAIDGPHIPEELNLDFQYEPVSYHESSSDISYSEKESEELKKNPEHCKKIDKGSMTCTVCHNPATGGNYEQCSYTSEPKEKKYAYVTEKKYDSDEPQETKAKDNTEKPDEPQKEEETKTKDVEAEEPYESRIPQEEKAPKKREDDKESYDETKDAQYQEEASNKEDKQKLVDDVNYDVPPHFAASVKSHPHHAHDHEDAKDEGDNSEFDEYHFRLFPELRNKDDEDDKEDYHTPEATKHNVEEVLAEFSKKDRSSCKKAEKNGMTCYLCLDANKIQHEECMYVQESRPQTKHVAYHEVKGVKDAPPEETKQHVVLTQSTTPIPTLEAAASEEVKATISYPPKKKYYKKKRNAKKIKKGKSNTNPEPTLKTPTEFEVGDEEGAFSAETRPVYSKLHGVKLPKYMLAKSEFEKEFDDFSGAL